MKNYTYDELNPQAQKYAFDLYGEQIDIEGESAWQFNEKGEREL